MTNKMSRNTYLMAMSTLVIGLGMAASQAMAQEAPPPPAPDPALMATDAVAVPAPGSFEALDANADTALEKEEIPADNPLSKKFKKADIDKNGQLSKDEFNAYLAKK